MIVYFNRILTCTYSCCSKSKRIKYNSSIMIIILNCNCGGNSRCYSHFNCIANNQTISWRSRYSNSVSSGFGRNCLSFNCFNTMLRSSANTSERKKSRSHRGISNTNKSSCRSNTNFECLNTNNIATYSCNVKRCIICNSISSIYYWIWCYLNRLSISVVV